MSEFIKSLERISRGKGQPLGFVGTAKENISPMMLIARLSPSEVGTADLAISEGVEAFLFDAKDLVSKTEVLQKISSSIGQVPWGVRLGTASIEQINKLSDAGCDYLVFKSEIPAHVLGDEKMGKVLEVDTSLSDSLARAIGQLSIDAILLAREDDSPLTLYRLMQWRRLIGLTDKPALVFLPTDMSDLETLLEIGARGLVADISGGKLKERIPTIREAIQGLPTSKKKSRERINAILPSIQPDNELFEEET